MGERNRVSKKRHQFFGLRYPATGLPVYLDEFGSQLTMKAVVYSGNGLKDIWVPLPGESGALTAYTAIQEATVEDWIGILQATDDPHIFELDESGSVKAVHRKSQRAVGAAVQWQVYYRDEYCCQRCGAQGGFGGRVVLSVDHFIPVESGGTDEMKNLVTLCKRCNKDKGSQDPKDYLSQDEYARITQQLRLSV